MVVIAVLAIVAALSVPRGLNRDTFAARGYAMEVASAARLSRTIAGASGCAVQLTIDGSGYRARQRRPLGTHCASTGAFNTAVNRSDGTAIQGTRPTSMAFSGIRRWTFNSDNMAQLAGGSTASLGSFTVSADPQTGLVSGP